MTWQTEPAWKFGSEKQSVWLWVNTHQISYSCRNSSVCVGWGERDIVVGMFLWLPVISDLGIEAKGAYVYNPGL